MTTGKWVLPDTISPVDSVCVQIQVPNDLKHIAAFWGALSELSKAWNWEDSYNNGSLVAYVWDDIIEQAVNDVRTGENCMPPALDCLEVQACMQAIIDNLQTQITTNTGNITDHEGRIVSLENSSIDHENRITSIEDVDIPQINLTLTDHENRITSIEDVDIPQINLTLTDHEDRITYLENYQGGGGNVVTAVKSTVLTIPIGAQITDNATTWKELLSLVAAHYFTLNNALIICDMTVGNSGVNPLSYFRLRCGSNVGTRIKSVQGDVSPQNITISEAFEDIDQGYSEIAISFYATATSTIFYDNQNITLTILEYATAPVTYKVTFDQDSYAWNTDTNQVGLLLSGGNPGNALIGQNVQPSEYIEVYWSIPSTPISTVGFDFYCGNLAYSNTHKLSCFIDDVLVDSSIINWSIYDINAWNAYLFSFTETEGSIIRIRLENISGSNVIDDMRLDNLIANPS